MIIALCAHPFIPVRGLHFQQNDVLPHDETSLDAIIIQSSSSSFFFRRAEWFVLRGVNRCASFYITFECIKTKRDMMRFTSRRPLTSSFTKIVTLELKCLSHAVSVICPCVFVLRLPG